MSHSISTMAHFKYNKNITYKTLFYLQWYSYTFKALKDLRIAGNGLYDDSTVEGIECDILYYSIFLKLNFC